MSLSEFTLGAFPVDDLIVQVAQKRLQTLDFVSEVVRESRNVNNWTPQDRQILLTKGSPVRATEFDTIGNPPGLAYTVQVNARCHVLQSQEETEPIDGLLSIMAADVIRAMTAVPDWYRFDGLSLDANFGGVERSQFDGAFDAVNIPFVVLYRVAETDPYVLRC